MTKAHLPPVPRAVVERLLRKSFGQHAANYVEVPSDAAIDPRWPGEVALGRYTNTHQASGVEVVFTDRAIYQDEHGATSRTAYDEIKRELPPEGNLRDMHFVTLVLTNGKARKIWLDGGDVQRDAMQLHHFLLILGDAQLAGTTE